MSADELKLRAPTAPELVWVPENWPTDAHLAQLIEERDELRLKLGIAVDVIADIDTDLMNERKKNRAA